MALVLATLVIAAAVGLLTGGRWSRLAELHIAWIPLAIAGLAMQWFAPGHGLLPVALLLVSFAALIAFAVRNLALPGFRLILLGVLLNFFVIALNGGMPVTRSALVASGQSDTLAELVRDGGVKHHIATSDDLLLPLGDVIVVPPVHNVVSVGDVLTYAGVAWLVIATMRAGDRRIRLVARPEGHDV
jgi:uncharacterized protein DUF5317